MSYDKKIDAKEYLYQIREAFEMFPKEDDQTVPVYCGVLKKILSYVDNIEKKLEEDSANKKQN